MKKLYSTIMMLAMMIAALSLTACGDDDEEENDDEGFNNSKVIFSITIDGEKNDYDKAYLDNWDLLGRWESPVLMIGTVIGDFRFEFPYGTEFSSFTTGYNSFEEDAEEIEIYGGTARTCTYVSGSATVLSNDGTNMKVRFKNYKFLWNEDREIIFDGTLNIVNFANI